MFQNDILILSQDTAKAYSRIIFEMANSSDIKPLNPYSKNQLVRFIKAVLENLNPIWINQESITLIPQFFANLP